MKNTELNNIEQSTPKQGTDVLKASVSRETILSGTDFRRMYALFRKDGLSIIESLYNAAYLSCHNKYENSVSAIKKQYQSIHLHPVAWSMDKRKVYKHNTWSIGMKLLEGTAKIIYGAGSVKKAVGRFFKKIGYIPKSMDNSIRAIRAFFRITGRLVLPALAVAVCAFSVLLISGQMCEKPVLGVYIDGVHVGNTTSVSDILKTKHTCENSLYLRYGSPIVLECDIDFRPQTAKSSGASSGKLISSGDMSIFDEYLSGFVSRGYGLYIDNKLAAVTSAQKWFEESIEEYIAIQKQNYMAKYHVTEEEVDKFVYNNNIKIIADSYPESYFLSYSDVRKLFGLPELVQENYELFKSSDLDDSKLNIESSESLSNGAKHDYSHLPNKLKYNGEELHALTSSIPTGSIVMDIAVVKDESERVVVPHTTEYVFDENLPEGMRRLISSGKNGEKIIYYKSTYMNGKLVKQEISGEEIVREPKNKVIRAGSKQLTEEEKKYIPTGTYIYPYQGNISSYYGWRILRGQHNFHQGLDIYGPRGEPVVAADAGEVIEVGQNKGYGKYCKIQHDEDTVTRYAHCDKITVKVGDFVAQGDQIGTLGDTGNATGVHVHFEIIESGETVNPLDFLGDL